MSNLSVKLDERTRQRLKQLSAQQGLTPHALMVKAIHGELERLEDEQAFLGRARLSLDRALAGAPVHDGPAFSAYLKERVRASLQASTRPPRQPRSSPLMKSNKRRSAGV